MNTRLLFDDWYLCSRIREIWISCSKQRWMTRDMKTRNPTKKHETSTKEARKNTKKHEKNTKIHEKATKSHENPRKSMKSSNVAKVRTISGLYRSLCGLSIQILKARKIFGVKIREQAVKKSFLIVKSPWIPWNVNVQNAHRFGWSSNY